MKQILALALSLVLLLSFAGCKASGLHDASTAATTTETAVTTPSRPEKVTLDFFLEGMPETQDATLYAREGYSIYITDDAWLEFPGTNGEMTWRSSYNADISITVIPNAGTSPEAAIQAIMEGFTVSDNDGEYVYAQDESGLFYRVARLIETPEGILAAVWNYTLEASEGFGVRLRIMADTLISQ